MVSSPPPCAWVLLLCASLVLCACQSEEIAERTEGAQGTTASSTTAPPSATAPAAPAPTPPAPGAPPVPGAPSAPPHHSFALGPAAAALVTQAHAQAAHDPQLAIDTLERALRIEPGNPLLWIELGEVHQGAGRYALADSMGRKALQLASGDSGAQARAWRLIAESLRARNRNAEAGDAQARSDALLAR